MNMDETDIKEITDLLSPERLGAIIKKTNSKDSAIDASVIEIHQESISLSGALMSIVAVIEIALRNAVYKNLDEYFKTNKRLFQSPQTFSWREDEENKIIDASNFVKRAKYNKLPEHQRIIFERRARVPKGTSYHDRLDIIRDPIPIADGDIIAQLAFSFWKKMYGGRYEKTLWKKTLKKTFPNENITRKVITAQLEIIYQTRNRLAHHEPVLFERFDNAINAIQFIAQNLNQPAPNPNSPLAKLLANDIKKITKQAEKLHTMMNRPTTP